MLTPGAKVLITAQVAADGTLSTGRVAVGKDGLTPADVVPIHRPDAGWAMPGPHRRETPSLVLGPMPNALSAAGSAAAVDSIAHLIQVALTPVFLLSGIGTLLNMFNLRQGRVSDHTEHAAELLHTEADAGRQALLRAHLRRLRQRQRVLDASIVLGAVGGAATCCAAFVLFVAGLREAESASWLFALFGVALGCTVFALMAFLADSVLAWHGLTQEGPLPRAKPP